MLENRVNNTDFTLMFTPSRLKDGKYREALPSFRHEKVKTCTGNC